MGTPWLHTCCRREVVRPSYLAARVVAAPITGAPSAICRGAVRGIIRNDIGQPLPSRGSITVISRSGHDFGSSLPLRFIPNAHRLWKGGQLSAHDDEFDAIFERTKQAGLSYGSAPWSLDDGELNDWNGGRGVYFKDPNGHVLELMTVPQ